MKKQDELVTVTLKTLAMTLATVAIKQSGMRKDDPHGWVEENWMAYMPAAEGVKESFNQPVVCDHCLKVFKV